MMKCDKIIYWRINKTCGNGQGVMKFMFDV